MNQDSQGILLERARRLQELLYISKDPLFEALGKNKPELAEFSDSHNISTDLKPIDISILGKNEDKLVEEILELVEKSLFTQKAGDKRKFQPELTTLNHSNNVKRLKFHPDITDSIKEQQLSFFNKDLDLVDILSVPQHYPTAPHNVSSLAELYYLTQTLPLIKLLPGSHKALMTETFELALLEGKIAVLYSRIEELKRQGKWSLRQPIKHKDPLTKQKYHWDNVLSESKWMAVDFKEQGKYKKACCVTMAQGIRDYWALGKEKTCIKGKIKHLPEPEAIAEAELAAESAAAEAVVDEETQTQPQSQDVKPDDVKLEDVKQEPDAMEDQQDAQDVMEDAQDAEDVMEDAQDAMEVDNAEETPAQQPSADAPEEPDVQEIDPTTNDPPAIDVALLTKPPGEGEATGEPEPAPEPMLPERILDRANRSDQLSSLETNYLGTSAFGANAPGPFKLHVDINQMKKIDLSIIRNLPKFTAFDDQPSLPPASDQLVPVSKLLYPFDDDEGFYKILIKEKKDSHTDKDSDKIKDLDGGVNSDIVNLDKVSPKASLAKTSTPGLFTATTRRFNYLRPPKPPLIKNIEFRSPTIWLPQDDKHLIHYVAEFCFNWDLISEHLLCNYASMRRYESNIERRTPWQCFERYIQLNEKFQFSDMKGPSSYQAQQWLEQAHRAQSTTKRRISPLGIGNESIQRGHRRLRWASMFDAMRKCMRKRENQLAKLNSRRGTDYANATTGAKHDKVPTPAELSRLKYERDKSIQEAYLNQQATRSRMMAAVAQQQGQAQTLAQSPSGQGQSQSPSSQAPAQTGQAQGQTGQAGPGQAQPGVARTHAVSPTHNMTEAGSSPGPVPADLAGKPGNPPYTQEQIQKLIQLQRQRKLMQYRGGPGGPTGPGGPGPSGPGPSGPGNAAPGPNAAGPSGPSGTNGPPINGNNGLNGPSGPQVQPSNSNNAKPRIHFAPAQVSAIINSIQTKNPNLSKEQVTKLAASYLANLQQQHQQRLNQQRLQGQGQGQGQGQNQNLGPGQNQNQNPNPNQNIGPSQGQGQRPARQPQVATLTAQERNQLQMLKAAKNQQMPHQLPPGAQYPRGNMAPGQMGPGQNMAPGQGGPGQMAGQMAGQNMRSNSGSPVNTPQLNRANMTKAEYEARLRMVMQKHQQKVQQMSYQGNGSPGTPNGGSRSGSGSGSGESSQ